MSDHQTKVGLVFDMAQLTLRDVLTIHQMMFDRLMVDEEQFALELAELLEDAANRYLDLSERISERYQQLRREGLQLPVPTHHAEGD